MTILEPMTLATDYLLAVLGLVLGRRLWRRPKLDNGSRRLWAGMMLAMALAAVAGGTAHGFADLLSGTGTWVLWRVTVWSIGIASLCAAASIARFAFSETVARWVVAFFVVQFGIYVVWMTTHDDFGYVILHYAPPLAFVALISAWSWIWRKWPGGPWIAVGVLVSFVAAGVQESGFSLHRHFNHNDLYHVIQMLGFYLLYRGGDMLEDRRGG